MPTRRTWGWLAGYLQVGDQPSAADCFAAAAGTSERVTPEHVLVISDLRYNAGRSYPMTGDSDKVLKLIGPSVAGMRTGNEKSDLLPITLELNCALMNERKE